MARDILELGADVIDDTVVEQKRRISPKKRNYIIGLSITGVLLAGAVTFGIVAANTFLLDLDNVNNITFIYTPDSMLEEGEEQTLTLYKLQSDVTYPSTFRVPSKVNGYKVTAIADEAFVGHSEIKKVILPDTITTVGERAFYGCSNLEKFTWSKNLINIGNDAFSNTKFYMNLLADSKAFYDLPSGVLIYVGNNYFDANTALVSDSVYSDASKVNEIKIKYGVTNVKAFSELNVKKIASGAMKGNDKIVYLDMPETLNEICNYTFQSCSNLKGVSLENSKIVSIDTAAFYDCENLEDVKFYSGLESLGDLAFAGTGIKEIPELSNLKSFGTGIFTGCVKLESVVFPASENLTRVPAYTFSGCSSLSSISWNDNEDYVASIGDGAFAGTAFETFVVPKNVNVIAPETFLNCENLKEVKMWANENYVVYGDEEDDEETPTFIDYEGNTRDGKVKGVGKIQNNAFRNCTNLTTISLYCDDGSAFMPTGAASIYAREEGKFVFPVSLSTTDDSSSITGSDNYTFSNTTASKVVIPSNQTSIGTFAFAGNSSITEVTLGSNSKLIKIGSNAFQSCENLTSIALPNRMTSIGASAFAGCTNLVSVTMPNAEDGITSISAKVFMNCEKLAHIDIPQTISVIKEDAFNGAKSLDYVIISEDINTINARAFANNRYTNEETKLPLYCNFYYEELDDRNFSSTWHDSTSEAYYLLKDGQEKVEGVKYWNGDKDHPAAI